MAEEFNYFNTFNEYVNKKKNESSSRESKEDALAKEEILEILKTPQNCNVYRNTDNICIKVPLDKLKNVISSVKKYQKWIEEKFVQDGFDRCVVSKGWFDSALCEYEAIEIMAYFKEEEKE
jgi:hypothetical protein